MPSVAPTPEEIKYMMAHIDETLQPNVWAASAICGFGTIGLIAMRIVSRHAVTGRWSVDLSDWLIIFAFCLYVVYNVSFVMTTVYGAGKHVILITDPAAPRALQIYTIVTENFYCATMAFIKFSILVFYGRIFRSPTFHKFLWGTGALVTGWMIAANGVSIGQCTPISFGWDPTTPGGKCIDYGLLTLAAGVINILTDFWILFLPIPLIWKLHTSKHKKYLLIFTFAMGSSACVVSIVRLAYTLKVGVTADSSWDNVPPGLLSTSELFIAFVAASIPTYQPLWRKMVHGSAVGSSANSAPSYQNDYKGGYASHAGASVGGSALAASRTGPGIQVTDDVELVKHAQKNGTWVRVADDDKSWAASRNGSVASQGSTLKSPGSK